MNFFLTKYTTSSSESILKTYIFSSEDFVGNIFTTHVNPRKLLEKSGGTKSEGILVLRPSDQKIQYQVLLGRRCGIV
jgi:hypothetical protein